MSLFADVRVFIFPFPSVPLPIPSFTNSPSLWVSFSSCSFTFSFLERLGGKRVNKIENLAKTSIIWNVNFWWGNAVAEYLLKMHMERGQKEKEGRQQLQEAGEKPCWVCKRWRSLFWSVGLTSERLGQHLPVRWQAQCSLQEQNKPGEPASGDAVECQELKLCLLLKVCGSGWHWLFFSIGLILMLSPALHGMNHQRAIPAKREQD